MKSALPLRDIRIIDFSHSWAGPHCSRLLADFGAQVIKVEYAKRLCLLRGGRKDNHAYNHHVAWFQVNRNKLALTLDLEIKRDRGILTDLIKISDVFIENSRAGVMDKLGFGYDDISKIKDDIIMLSMTAFGSTGPYCSYAGYGAVMEAVSGIQSLTAYKKGEKPQRVKELDVTNGVAGAGAVMTALMFRKKTGQGQHIDFSQLEAAAHATIGEHLLEYSMKGSQTLPLGNRHWKFAPQGCYRCLGDDKWIALTIRSESEWQVFCEILGRPEWILDKRFATEEARMKNHDALDLLIEEWTTKQTHYQVMQMLQDQGIPAGAVLDVSELSRDPHLKERAYFVRDTSGADRQFMGMPFKLSKGAGRVLWQGPDLGQHNEYVVCELLGRSPEEVPAVREDQIGTAYDPE